MKLVHLINRVPTFEEAVVLSSIDEREAIESAFSDYQEVNIYNIDDLIDEGEWPIEMPLDRELTQ